MKIGATEIVDTFAEAFNMCGSRIVITAETPQWAMAAAQSITGFATSVIACKCEAGIEKQIPAADSPDLRPGVSVLLFAMSADGLGKRLVERIGQCVMTCPTTACFNGMDSDKMVDVGGQLRYFGDGHQISKVLGDRRSWRIPVMDGEFVIDEAFAVRAAIGGGNLLLLSEDQQTCLKAATAAVRAMRKIDGVILPFPDGVVRSGSKVGSRYKSVPASTNEAYCPSLRGVNNGTALPDGVNCVLEIVIDGFELSLIKEALCAGIHAAADNGIEHISAGNYGGGLGQFQISLHDLLRD